VLGPDNKAQARPLRLGREVDDGWIIEDGLSSGETIIVDGLMRVRPGAPVTPVAAAAQAAPDTARTENR
jgi:membrane fusion protein, multidrug efflux system